MNCHNCGMPLEWDGTQQIVVCESCRTYRSHGTPDDSVDRVVSLGNPGVLIQEELFEMLVRNRRAEYRGAASRSTALDPEQLSHERPCPACRHTMNVHPNYGPGNIVIDSCGHCHLVWLDLRETARVAMQWS